jgi:hypothetical protein
MPQTRPYISVIATARNDNHGGNLLGRIQVFVDAWVNQAKRHNLASELILVEWNPPADKPKLADVLRWPSDTGPCEIRIIEVPAEIHGRYQHAAALPLYQMIAKNAGILRARGEFLLVTNIDVLFSSELVDFLARRQLQKGRLYRLDRTDVDRDVPVDGTLDDQLAYCHSHVIRLFTRDGVFPVTPEGFRVHEKNDIAAAGSGIWFGSGWFEVEAYTTEYFRWMRDEAELHLRVPPGGGTLQLEFEAGPGVGPAPHVLQVLNREGAAVAEWSVTGRVVVRLAVPPAAGEGLQVVRLHAADGGRPVPTDLRPMNFRFFRLGWVAAGSPDGETLPLQETVSGTRSTLARMAEARLRAGLASALQMPWKIWRSIRLLRKRGADIFDSGGEFQTGPGWYSLERYGAQRFRWASSEVELRVRLNDGSASLGLLIEPGPAIGYRPFDLTVRTKSGQPVGRARIQGLTYVEFAVPVQPGEFTSLILNPENSGSGDAVEFPGDDRTMNFRVYGVVRGSRRIRVPRPAAAPWSARVVSLRAAEVDWMEFYKHQQRAIGEMGRPAFLHLFACGDFQMMAREHWFNMRGYAELDQYSMHLDSLLSYTAHHMGVHETMLVPPMRVFHIEHDVGTGWTPEGDKKLTERLAKKSIQTIVYPDLALMVTQMRRLHTPLMFNLDTWGLGDCELEETAPVHGPR